MPDAFQLNNRQLNRFIFVLTAIVLLFMFKYRFGGESGEEYKRVINGDGKGYYAYLPAVFIYQDLTFSFFDKQPEKFGYQYSNTFLLNHDKKNLNKYTCGEAILLIPFFLLAVVYSWFMGLPVDGYNGAFQIFVALGNLFYFILGLIITKKVLQWYRLSNLSIALSLLALTLGSNILNYVVNESSMSHVFSFFMIALNVYTAKRFFEYRSFRVLLLGGLTLGLIVLIRPINGMVVFAYPFLAGDKNFFGIVKEQFRDFVWAGLAACAVIFIQLLIWKIELGQFLIYGYKNEGFYFNQAPAIGDYLFSFKRGAFIYSPVLFLSFIGLWNMRHEKRVLLWFCFFMLLVVYVHASWWSWYYGDGFGERPLTDFYVFFALAIAWAFDRTGKRLLRYVLLPVLAIFVLLHQVFMYQYVKGIIHPYSMDYEKFKYVFLKTSDKYRYLFKCDVEDFYHPRGVNYVAEVESTLKDPNAYFPEELKLNKADIMPGQYLETKSMYPLTWLIKTDASWLFKMRYAEISFDYMQPLPDSAASNMMIYVTMSDEKGETYYFNANPVAGRVYNTTNKWENLFERIKIGIPEKTGTVGIFIDNTKNKKLYIRNFSVKVTEPKP